MPTCFILEVMNLDSAHHDPTLPVARCLDSQQLGEYLGLSVRSIDRLREGGAISYLRIGGGSIRFAPEDVVAFIAQSRVVEGASS